MLADLARALLGAIAAGVLPGYFWAGFLRPAGGLGERLAWSAALSLASVPLLALDLARALGTGVTLGVAIVSIAVVLGSGALALVLRGPPADRAAPALRSASALRDGPVLRGAPALRGAPVLRGTAVLRGTPGRPDVPVLPRPRAVSDWRTLALIVAAFGVALAVALGLPSPQWLLVVMLAALLVAGALASAGTESGWQPSVVLREPALAVVLALTAVRAYAGPVRHDWPYLRGSDLFSHAVMAEQMLAHGTYTTYLIYPPGFSTLTAVICRVSGLTPLALFPVLAPALLVLTTLAAYALATKVWGWEYGLAAAALSGLVLRGPYASFAEGRYPDLTAAYFLLVMLVAALITLYGSPTVRSGVLVAIVGGSVVLYHSVATLYLALLLAAVGVVGLPYLLLRQRRRRAGAHGQARAEVREEQHAAVRSDERAAVLDAGHAEAPDASRQGRPDAGRTNARAEGRTEAPGEGRTGAREERGADGRAEARRLAWTLTFAFCGLGVLAVAYAGYTYLLGSSGAGTSGTSTAVSIAVGSQPVLSVTNVLSALSSAVVWLGVFGLAVLVAGIRYLRRPGQVLTVLTLVLWFGLMYAGSRTAADGFPQRFERDLGGPLSVLGALGAGLILQSLVRWRAPRRAVAVLAAAAACAVVAIAGVQAIRATVPESHPVHTGILDPQVAAAGAWLGQHNAGGTIISTPAMNSGITNRAVLAMGGYTGLQSYSPFRIAHPRSLPTAGRAPLLDSREVLTHPASCRSASIFASQDVRYVVLYRFGHAADLAGFRTDPARYRRVFENPSVVIYVPSHAPDDKCHGAG